MHPIPIVAATLVLAMSEALAGQAADPRLREVRYDPQSVVTVPVKRGIVTDIVLDGDEAITDVASGLGGDCSKPEASWCIAAQPGGRHIFVKPKSTAGTEQPRGRHRQADAFLPARGPGGWRQQARRLPLVGQGAGRPACHPPRTIAARRREP